MKSRFKVFDFINYFILVLLGFVTLYPLWNALAISLNDGRDTMRGGITFFPRVFTLENYIIVFKDPSLLNSFIITVERTLLGTVTSVLATAILAYGLSDKRLLGKKFYIGICVVSMYFSGGLIPYYILIYKLGLVNNFLVYIIPSLISVFNVIVMMTYFKQLPDAIKESAKIDGAREFTIFFRIILPVSAPIIATISLFNGVDQWNSWFDAYIFITKENLLPLQNIIVRIINTNSLDSARAKASAGLQVLSRFNRVTAKSLNMSTMMISIIPIVLVYPFLQKYFIKGIMIGSVKG